MSKGTIGTSMNTTKRGKLSPTYQIRKLRSQIKILTLKREWNEVKKLQRQILSIERSLKAPPKPVNFKKKYGMFAWKAQEFSST